MQLSNKQAVSQDHNSLLEEPALNLCDDVPMGIQYLIRTLQQKARTVNEVTGLLPILK